MKLVKIILSFVIFYFIITAYNAMREMAKNISMGNRWIEYGFYVLVALLSINYLIIPLIKYISKPSLSDIELMLKDNKSAKKKIVKHLKRPLPEKTRKNLKI